MIVWIASYGRSGNTFFRIVMHHLYGVKTYAAFNASEVLIKARADGLVGHMELPAALQAAVAAGRPEQIRLALEELEASKELFVFKTHAWSTDLFGTKYRAILIVRDGRDALASYANYLVDIRFDSAALHDRLRRMRRSRSALLNARAWVHLAKILMMGTAKKVGLRHYLVSRKIDRLLGEKSEPYLDWSATNRSWMERDPKPVIVYFNDLICNPVASVAGALKELEVDLVSSRSANLPSFPELNARYPSFFRSGTSGEWKRYFSPAQEDTFMSKHAEMMKALRF